MFLTAVELALVCTGGCTGSLTPVSLTPVSPDPPLIHATLAQIAEWESTVLVRSQFVCSRVVWQIEGETVLDAIAIYEHDYVPDDCLALLPTGEVIEGIPYGGLYIGFGGTFGGDSAPPDTADGLSENTCGVNFPGHCLIYIADTPRQML